MNVLRTIALSLLLSFGGMSAVVTAAPAQTIKTVLAATASPKPVAAAAPKARFEGRHYSMRGLLGGALGYSKGMDTVAAKAQREANVKGYVKPHWRWREFVATAVANYKIDKLPIILSGHSVGADAVSTVAEDLRRQGVPVALAVYYDPTSLVQPVPSNVTRAVEYRQNALFQLGQGFITLSPGFKGSSQIYTKWIAHTALDDDPAVHSSTVCEIKAAIAKSPINLCPLTGGVLSMPTFFGFGGAPAAPAKSSGKVLPAPIYSHGDAPSGQ